MRFLFSLTFLCAAVSPASNLPHFQVISGDGGSWPAILSSVGFRPAAGGRIFIAPAGAAASTEWKARVESGAILILEGESTLAEMFAFCRTKDNSRVGSLIDVHQPRLPIVWEKTLELPVFSVPKDAQVFARERWGGSPLIAGVRRGAGAVLWVATSPGPLGYERFPYLLPALHDLGVEPPFRAARLWAFFDSAYRTRADVNYLAVRWRKAGIATLHVAAWHNYEPDADRDAWLAKLIETCHREGILVYAWLELPHVSDRFWEEHPEWRERTAALQDAQLDWRKLMNLANRDCFHAVSAGIEQLIGRFDWDGVNLAELYFESLEGIGNPSRFTPMNDDVRSEFRARKGFDPIGVFGTRNDAVSQRTFLNFRAELAARMQREWLEVLESARRQKPYLGLVVTHIDDRFDSGIRDELGADTARTLPLLSHHDFTFMIEDPATVWHLGPQRYQTIAEQYRSLTPRADKLAIDLNIVERYQNVYPTKQQTGTELFQLVHQAAVGFRQVALYFENSLLPPDLELLPYASVAGARIEMVDGKATVEADSGVGLRWKGPARVDGQPWPVFEDGTLWLPRGRHAIEPSAEQAGMHLLSLNGELESIRLLVDGALNFSYTSQTRAIARLDRPVVRVLIDGVPQSHANTTSLMLPCGRHSITVFTE